MQAEKYKIWNTEKKEWFRPNYPGNKPGKNNKIVTTHETREILFSQSGEIYIHEKKGDEPSILTHVTLVYLDYYKEALGIYIPCIYTGMKDSTGKKIYQNDALVNQVGEISVVEFKSGCFICRVKDPDCDHKPDYLCDVLKANAVYFGNVLESPEILK